MPSTPQLVSPLKLAIDKEKQLIADNGPANGKARLVKLQVRIGNNFIATNLIAKQIFVPTKGINRPSKVIGTAFGYGVDTGAAKAAFSNVKGSKGNLNLFHRIIRHWLGIGLSAWRRIIQAKRIVEIRAIERDIVVQPISAAKTEIAVVARV